MGEETAEVIIRQASIDDLPAIFHLGERVFTSQDYSNLYRTWDAYEVTTYFNQDSEHLLVADSGGTVVGFAIGTTIEKARTAWNYGHLVWLGVDPRFSRMKVGSLLFDRFRSMMEEQGVRMLMVDTQADNAPAIAFFKKKGFVNPTEHVYLTMQL
jgi:ribosomal protein S18 acetylase RimI-like enzyme